MFPASAKADFAASYPEGVHKLIHELEQHPLLELEMLAQLAELLPEKNIEYNRGDVPVGITGKPGQTGLSIGETIRSITTANSWAVLRNIEQEPAYRALLEELLDELRPLILPRTGKMLKLQGFIFVSSPNAVTPYHFDPEHNILMQLRGSKVMTVFEQGQSRFAPDTIHEEYHTGGGRELIWDERFAAEGIPFTLDPGNAIYVPVMAPHHVKNGPEISISLSITWRSEWSFAEADARAFNKLLRKWGFDPKPPKRWPRRNLGKAIAWRILRRIPGLH